MTLQKIKSIQGKDEYVLLPMAVYRALKDQIEKELAACEANQNDEQAYEPFVLEDYVDNLVALARIKAGITTYYARTIGSIFRPISVNLNAVLQLWDGEFWTDGYFSSTVGRHGNESTIMKLCQKTGSRVSAAIEDKQLTHF